MLAEEEEMEKKSEEKELQKLGKFRVENSRYKSRAELGVFLESN